MPTMSFESMLQFEHHWGLQCDAAGRTLVYATTTADESMEGYRSTVRRWTQGGDGGPAEIAEGHSPQISGDGETIAWLHDGAVHWAAQAGGASSHSWGTRVGAFGLARDSATIATLSTRVAAAPASGPTEKVLHITDLNYKANDSGYFTRSETVVSVISLADGSELFSRTFGVEGPALDVAISPDGKSVAIVVSLKEMYTTWSRQIVVVRLDMPDAEPLVVDGFAVQDLSWSPDGTKIAFRATDGGYHSSDNLLLWVLDLGQGTVLQPLRQLDRFIGTDRNTEDSFWSYSKVPSRAKWVANDQLYVSIAERFSTALARVDLRSQELTYIEIPVEMAVINDYAVGSDASAVFTAISTPTEPSSLGVLLDDGYHTIEANVEFAEAELSHPRILEWSSYDGTAVDGLFYPAIGVPEGTTAPCITYVHGGPYRQHTSAFSVLSQAMASRGFSVFCPNPRGSQGYGAAFAAAIGGSWGGLDYQDIRSGVDHLLSNSLADPSQLFITGASYGGYISAWAVTQEATFAAAVVECPVTNIPSHLGTACARVSISFGMNVFGDVFDESTRRELEMRSPAFFANECTTPTLVIQTMLDYTCPIDQGEQFYHALKRANRRAELVLIPGESHNLPQDGTPDKRVVRLEWMAGWFSGGYRVEDQLAS